MTATFILLANLLFNMEITEKTELTREQIDIIEQHEPIDEWDIESI